MIEPMKAFLESSRLDSSVLGFTEHESGGDFTFYVFQWLCLLKLEGTHKKEVKIVNHSKWDVDIKLGILFHILQEYKYRLKRFS